MSLKICFIGAGNLATHLAKSLHEKGFVITQIYSRTEAAARQLAERVGADFTSEIHKIDTSAHIFFVLLKDSVVRTILSQISFEDQLLVHCSGSLPLSVLSSFSKNTGVFYPVQTFSKNREVDFSSVPVFIESNSTENEKILLKIAGELSDSVAVLDSENRKTLHISAVFANNFVNHCYAISADILSRRGIAFETLKPLILETAQKVQELTPERAQTGPAVRFDENVISSHLAQLQGINNYRELYNSISKSIFEHHKKQ